MTTTIEDKTIRNIKEVKFKIYQIESWVECFYRYEPYNEKTQKKFKRSDYGKIYEGSITVDELTYDVNECLDRLFTKFNTNLPQDFKGHSLSMSDVVEIGGEGYYCNSYGWTKLEKWNGLRIL